MWDFLDRSNEPFMVVPASASPVTCLEFWNQASPQLMGVGDAQGILHIMEIPRSLRRPLHKEASDSSFVNLTKLLTTGFWTDFVIWHLFTLCFSIDFLQDLLLRCPTPS